MIRTRLWQLMGICLAGCGAISAADEPPLCSIPMSAATFSADEGCQWMPAGYECETIRRNGQYLAAPQPGEDWAQWIQSLQDYRTAVRTRLNDPTAVAIDMRFDGVRAWTRVARNWAWAFELAPGEQVRLRGEACSLEGNNRLCLAFDWLARTAGFDGAWQGWSGVVETATLRHEDGWQPFEMTVTVPPFDAAASWARPILGMDGTFDKTPGRMALRRLELCVAKTDLRERTCDHLRNAAHATRLRRLHLPPRGPALDDTELRVRLSVRL